MKNKQTVLLLIPFWLHTIFASPNIVILLADNLGYNDISLFGARATSTPNVDRIGQQGIQFKNWNSAAHLCSASRAALLTGKYPVRTGIYPGVFHADSVHGLLPSETTLAEYLRDLGYATSIVGKWHLGHNTEFLPTNQGFDEWLGIPYHASGGSVEDHVCNYDHDETMWLPLYENQTIVQQPVNMHHLAAAYADRATDFMRQRQKDGRPFFLYLPFSHVHQLCAPRDFPEQSTCQWSSKSNSTFANAVEEMDWIVGRVLDTLDELGIVNDTLVLFTSDNGPWVAEQKCSGSKGPFVGQWLMDHTASECTACPHDYIHDPNVFRQCTLPNTTHKLQGVPCGADTGLGSLWEANLRMPTVVQWPGRILPQQVTMELVSTLDIVPTILSIVGMDVVEDVDGIDISDILFHPHYESSLQRTQDRVLFFWRDGFQSGPLPAPYGRFDVAAVKIGRYKAWIWTKSAHYNNDVEVYHDPPLLFDVEQDPAEAFPLDPNDHASLLHSIPIFIEQHKESVDWTYPLTLARDPRLIPCVDRATDCRTTDDTVHQQQAVMR